MSVANCKAPGCKKAISSDLYACMQHWNDLPDHIRSAIWAGFRLLKQGKGSEWVSAHREAQKYWEVQYGKEQTPAS